MRALRSWLDTSRDGVEVGLRLDADRARATVAGDELPDVLASGAGSELVRLAEPFARHMARNRRFVTEQDRNVPYLNFVLVRCYRNQFHDLSLC